MAVRAAPLCLLALCGVMTACEDSPLRPGRGYTQLLLSCSPAGTDVSCTATLYGDPVLGRSGDVTAESTWSVSDPSLGSFSRPGLFTPVRTGEVGLRARYQSWESSEPWFLVGPGTEARWLYFVSGKVLDASTNEPLAGAEVRVLDGHAAGAHAPTNQVGHYRIDRVLTGEVFTIVASMSGYSDHPQTYRVDPPVGPDGSGPFLDFRLEPLP